MSARCRERSATAGLSEARERTADWSRLPVRKPPTPTFFFRTDALACNHNILFPELVLPDSTFCFWTLSRCRNGSGSEWVRSAAPILNVRAGKWCENPNHPKHRHFRNLQTGCRSRCILLGQAQDSSLVLGTTGGVRPNLTWPDSYECLVLSCVRCQKRDSMRVSNPGNKAVCFKAIYIYK